MNKVEYINISLPRLKAYVDATSKMGDILWRLKPNNDEHVVDWKSIHDVWDGIIELHNSLLFLMIKNKDKQADDWAIYTNIRWIDEIELSRIESKNQQPNSDDTSLDVINNSQ